MTFMGDSSNSRLFRSSEEVILEADIELWYNTMSHYGFQLVKLWMKNTFLYHERCETIIGFSTEDNSPTFPSAILSPSMRISILHGKHERNLEQILERI